MAAFYVTKDPNAVLDYGFDWEEWLDGDTIDTSTWTPPAGITKDSDSKTTLTTTVVLSGGTAGQWYAVLNRITTAGGLTDDRTLMVRVADK